MEYIWGYHRGGEYPEPIDNQRVIRTLGQALPDLGKIG